MLQLISQDSGNRNYIPEFSIENVMSQLLESFQFEGYSQSKG